MKLQITLSHLISLFLGVLFLIRKKILFKINNFGLKPMQELKILTYRKKSVEHLFILYQEVSFCNWIIAIFPWQWLFNCRNYKEMTTFECGRMLKLFHYHLRSEHIFWSDNNKDECISLPVYQYDLWEILAYFVMFDNACAKKGNYINLHCNQPWAEHIQKVHVYWVLGLWFFFFKLGKVSLLF